MSLIEVEGTTDSASSRSNSTAHDNSVNYISSHTKAAAFSSVSNVQDAYVTLDTTTVIDYVERTLEEWLPLHGEVRLEHGEVVAAEEVGDGNLNLVFRLLNVHGVCRAVLKQSLPYVRCVGESWPLTLDRNRLEADTLRSHYRFAPAVVEHVLFHNSSMAATVVEDLSDCVIWRRELVRGHHLDHVCPRLGRYLGRVFFYTSDLAQDCESKKAAVQEFTNADMCGITEDLFFTDPFLAHPRNNYEPALEALVASLLRRDTLLRVRSAQLNHRFMNCPEAHLHGDLHSGSVFVDAHRVKVIDAEFGFYGPMGFDLGTVMGNLLINYIALPALQEQRLHTEAADSSTELASDKAEPRVAADLSTAVPSTPQLLLHSLHSFCSAFHATFTQLAASETRDAAFAFPGYEEELLQQVWADAVGFAGSEMIRRTVGLAHVADLDSIQSDGQRLAAKEDVLRLGAYLVKYAASLKNVGELVQLAESGRYKAAQ
ncbi:methylthioribose kinase [Leptomonas pyrrhocoris]|uniref:S-methyl-5-thioribose kinase n=1 Tax=Leptomonas pyrrhocoris TaxID=157538 RepID=A0A0N0DT05_LEPPY|nr:methylthioribose kinase [Leptomonas pyrrhocoris]KPA76722.1 methylthioribose kinase [Leptomonas pyrrhocoris]|eukprot:XP_015655161.1 methylthioribose kinase [Leptomonas pyrrhocoris]